MNSNTPPELDNRLTRIEDKIDKIQEAIHTITNHHTDRLARIETTQKGIITVSSLLFTTLATYILGIFGKPS